MNIYEKQVTLFKIIYLKLQINKIIHSENATDRREV